MCTLLPLGALAQGADAEDDVLEGFSLPLDDLETLLLPDGGLDATTGDVCIDAALWASTPPPPPRAALRCLDTEHSADCTRCAKAALARRAAARSGACSTGLSDPAHA
jgi:hypothetical protein